jgi:LuxR family maltose regulon positive regulatory protein
MQLESAPRALLRTRLVRPRLPRDVVVRPRLFARLDELPLLTLVVAPAGYGKTTLVNTWLQTCALPNAWLSLSGQDLDLVAFIGYLTAAVTGLFPDFGHEVLDLVAGLNLPPPQVVAQILVNELDTLAQDFVLVLDDYHALSDTAIHGLVAELLRFPPRPLHLVMITRQDPPLALAKARAQGALVEIRAHDLRFTQAEASQLLRGELARQADPETVDALVQGVEGWAVGLRLGALYARRHQEAVALRTAVQGDSRYMMDYLADEVLATLPEELRSFLFKTSILERLSGAFCAAVVGDDLRPADGQRMLRELEAAGIFTVALDEQGEWFQYHPVFRRLLQRQLTARFADDEIADLHRRAARWRWTHGFHEEATRHALTAGDVAVAVAWVAAARPALMNHDEWRKLERWLRLFPNEAVATNPELLVAQAWIQRSRFDLAGVTLVIGQAESALARAGLEPAVARTLTAEIEVLRTFLCYWSADLEGIKRHGTRALAQIPRGHLSARTLAMLFVGAAEIMGGDTARAYEIMQRTAGDAAEFGYLYEMRRLSVLQFIQWHAGDLQGVAEGASQVLA